jgi:hypothetical protein
MRRRAIPEAIGIDEATLADALTPAQRARLLRRLDAMLRRLTSMRGDLARIGAAAESLDA